MAYNYPDSSDYDRDNYDYDEKSGDFYPRDGEGPSYRDHGTERCD